MIFYSKSIINKNLGLAGEITFIFRLVKRIVSLEPAKKTRVPVF